MLSLTSICLLLLKLTHAASPPNIIMIISDDLGYDDLGFKNNQQVSSPNIDNLITQGQFIKYHYAMSICSPTRATLLTGRYTLHTGINNVIPPDDAYGLPLTEQLLPEILKTKANYATHAIGKWHLGFYKWDYTPTFRGFDTFYGYYSGGEDYYTHRSADTGSNVKPPPHYYDLRYDNQTECGVNCSQVQVAALNVYSTYLFNQRAVDIIDQHDKSQPLFLYLAYQAVHAPTEVPQQYQNMYINTINNTLRQEFAGMVTCMDDSIGNITDKLQKEGYLDATGNTILVFLSDNGGQIPGDPGGDHGLTGTCNDPLRGGKHTLWEGGTRTIGGVWSTADIGINSHSGNYSQLFHVADWMPSLLQAAGIDPTSLGIAFDGVSHWDNIKNGNNETVRDTIWYGWKAETYYSNETALGYQGWKLYNTSGGIPDSWWTLSEASNGNETMGIKRNIGYGNYKSIQDMNATGNYLLFNLYDDPGEHNDVSSQYPEKVQEMAMILANLSATGVPQVHIDHKCPNKTNPFVSGVGDTLAPWC